MKSKTTDISEKRLQEQVAHECSVSSSSRFRIVKEASACTEETIMFSSPHKNCAAGKNKN